MKNPSDLIRHLRVCRLPLRMFHGALAGVFLGTLLALAVHWSGSMIPTARADENPTPPPAAPTPPQIPTLNPTPDDLDGDGIHNTWETQFHHDPNNAADAGADFDNDGLTAKQEYDLYQRTNGAAGNPLGQWETVSTQLDIPALFPYDVPEADVAVVDVNTGGTVLFQSRVIDSSNSMTASRAAVLAQGEAPVEITAIFGTVVVPFDINDIGTVVGRTHENSMGIAKGFIWSAGMTSELLTPAGSSAVAKRINNHGNWVGFQLDPDPMSYRFWIPAASINGTIRSDDLFENLAVSEMIGINENDQVLASYLDPWHMTCSLAVARQVGSFGWVEAAGFPTVVQDWSIPRDYNDAVINNFGEFAAAKDTLYDQGGNEAYYFDGDVHPLAGSEMYGLSDDGMVLAGAPHMPDPADPAGLALTADGVRTPLAALCPAGFIPTSAAMASNGRIAATNGTTLVALELQQDSDRDGMSDDFETYRYLDPYNPTDAFLDPDADNISNLGEYYLRLDPNQFNPRGSDGQLIDLRPGIDTDGDGIPNIWEWNNGLDFEDATDAPQDPDHDGFTNLQEYQLNTDPFGLPALHAISLPTGARFVDDSGFVYGSRYGENGDEIYRFNPLDELTVVLGKGPIPPWAWLSLLHAGGNGRVLATYWNQTTGYNFVSWPPFESASPAPMPLGKDFQNFNLYF